MPIFEIWTTETDLATKYVVHGFGDITKYNDPEDDKLKAEEGNDVIHKFPDGSYVLVGSTGNRYGDAYKVTEKPYAFTRHKGEGDFKLVYDGTEVTDQIVGNNPRPDAGYTGIINEEALAAFIEEKAGGYGGGSGNEDGGNPDRHYYGGGDGYPHSLTVDDATRVVDTHDGLRRALGMSEAGDVVYVRDDAVIYSPSKRERYEVPDGVTLASNGALLHTDVKYGWGGHGLVMLGQEARVTGLRIRGPHPDVRWKDHTGDYEMSGVYSKGKNAEVDNCEVYGWAMCINQSAPNLHVHHCHIHHANMEGLGYGVLANSTGGLIEWNHIEHWRHAVAASGAGGYEARNNLVDGPCISHAFDQHSPGGTYTKVHHNTLRAGHQDDNDKHPILVALRGEDVDNAEIYKNWVLNNPQEPRDDPAGWTDEFIIRLYHNGQKWSNVEWWDNHLDGSEPAADIGAPRPYP